jgi:uncharacterized protein YjbJ (UPF0337 family)
MSGNSDDMKGRMKEAAGDLTNDDDLKREGKADQAGAKVKDAAEKLKDKVGDAVDAVKKKMDDN